MCLTKLDVGLTARPAMPADVQAVTDLMNVCLQLDLGRAPLDVSMLQTDWANPYRKPETTIRLVFAGDLLVGYAGAWIEPPAVVVYGGIYVHPDYRARGIGEYLAAWLKDLVVSAAFPLAPDDAKVVLHMERPETDSYTRTLLLGAGYRIVRYGLRMLIALDSAPPAPIFPEGIEIRTFNRVRDLPADRGRNSLDGRHHVLHVHYRALDVVDLGALERDVQSLHEELGDVCGVL